MRERESETMRKWENEKVREWESERMSKWENEKVREWESERMRKWENEKVREWESERMKKWENGKMREWESERMRKWYHETVREWESERMRFVKESLYVCKRVPEWVKRVRNFMCVSSRVLVSDCKRNWEDYWERESKKVFMCERERELDIVCM